MVKVLHQQPEDCGFDFQPHQATTAGPLSKTPNPVTQLYKRDKYESLRIRASGGRFYYCSKLLVRISLFIIVLFYYRLLQIIIIILVLFVL
ncbi:MAG: hypothetical protein ACRC4N_10795, partial [Gammaproteobacteria bacterium]